MPIPRESWVPNPPKYWFEWPFPAATLFLASYLRTEERELEASGLNRRRRASFVWRLHPLGGTTKQVGGIGESGDCAMWIWIAVAAFVVLFIAFAWKTK